MEKEIKRKEELFKKLRNLFLFLTMFQLLLLFSVCFVIWGKYLTPQDNLQSVFLWALGFTNILTFFLMQMVHIYFIKNKPNTAPLETKIEKFKFLAVFRLGLLFIDNLLNIVILLFSQSMVTLIVIVTIILLSYFYRPSLNSFNKIYKENLEFG